ncbi:MAG: hypothetical protein HFH93_13195 [Lachnospiraceae bacterium]|nr:hypothetical protein [Lachnospiraceae bacterium]
MDVVLIFWMVVLILCIGIEVLTLGLTTIWFAAGALVAIFAALLYAPIFVQVILFLLVSLVMLFFTRPLAVKYFNTDRVKTNVESMVGRQGIVTEEIDNVQAAGQVTVSGQEWSARSWEDKVRIPAGTVVTVAAISGVKLIVRVKQQQTAEVSAGLTETGAQAASQSGQTAEAAQEPDEAREPAQDPPPAEETEASEPGEVPCTDETKAPQEDASAQASGSDVREGDSLE